MSEKWSSGTNPKQINLARAFPYKSKDILIHPSLEGISKEMNTCAISKSAKSA